MYRVIEVSSDTNIGGAGKCILTLAAYHNRDMFEMIVALPKGSRLKPYLVDRNVRIIEIDGMADKSLDFSDILKLRELFKELKPDIVHTHASMSARIAARTCGVKVVYTRHSVFEPSPKISKGIGKKINGMINNFFADSIIAVAEAAKDNLTATGVDERKIEVILNGVEELIPDCAQLRRETRALYGVNEGDKVISIVARLTEVKGHEYVIEAAEQFKNENIKFLIAGTGDNEEHLKALVKEKGLENTVIFTGFVRDVERLMNITDIQVNASYGTEATSLSLLEGMSLGIPAVVSDFGGNPGVIENGVNGFVVPKKDAAAMAEKIRLLLDDEELYAAMRQQAVKIFKQKFTAEIMTKNTEQHYLHTLGRY